MRLNITGINLSATGALRAHVERRIGSAVGRCAHYVRMVHVSFMDVNGPRGGHDKQCKIYAALTPRGQLTITETDRDLYSAVKRSTARLKHRVRRHANYRPKNRRQLRYRRSTGPAQE